MKTQTKNLTIKDRIAAPTPSFFKKIRNIGLILGAVGGALLAAPVTLPAAITSLAGYLATAGIVASAVSAATVETKQAAKAKKASVKTKTANERE